MYSSARRPSTRSIRPCLQVQTPRSEVQTLVRSQRRPTSHATFSLVCTSLIETQLRHLSVKGKNAISAHSQVSFEKLQSRLGGKFLSHVGDCDGAAADPQRNDLP